MTETTKMKFYFDPVCPWAWRTSQWIRQVQTVRPLEVEWDFLSLKAVNSGTNTLKDSHFQSEASFRIMALIRRHDANANDIINKLYIAFGKARHEKGQNIGDEAVVKAILSEAGLDTSLFEQAMEDETSLDDVQKSHDSAIALGGFGVPTLAIVREDGSLTKGMFGPVIDQVPEGEDAAQLWERVSWLMERPEFFELKRSR
jgi:predicted DsbA family dithiol-disulfide isomerase